MDKEVRPSIFKRALALVIDFIILGSIGYISGLFFEDFYVSLGKYGTLIGSAITITYFTILQSKIGKGQTLGKKAIGAKVTDLNGEYLSVDKSLLRSCIVFLPILNIEIFSGGTSFLIIGILLVLITFSSLYLILINKSRRCLHDILVCTVVTNKAITEFEISESRDRSIKRLIPFAIFSVLMIGIGIYTISTDNTFSKLLSMKEKIEESAGVVGVSEVNSNSTTYNSTSEPSKTFSSVSITVRIDDKNEASNTESKYFDEFYKIIKAEMPESQSLDAVIIKLYYGYNIGIANKTQSVSKTFEK